MRTTVLILVTILIATLLLAASLRSREQRDMTTAKSHTPTNATAKVTVENSEAKPYDQTAGPALMEIRLSEKFTGDIDGESPVRVLQVLRDDHSASLVSVQRFRGKLGGREGTFVLQGQRSSPMARLRLHGLSSRVRVLGSFQGCTAKAASQAILAKDPTQR